MDRLLQELILAAGRENVKTKEPMGPHVTFRAGGTADYFVTPDGETALSAVVRACNASQVPYYVLGNGSNLLVGDLGYHGVIIRMGSRETRSGPERGSCCQSWRGRRTGVPSPGWRRRGGFPAAWAELW